MRNFPGLIGMLFLAALAPARAAMPALGNGEELKYKVGWGIIGGAGTIVIGAKTAPPESGTPRLMVTTTIATAPGFRWLYSFTARSEATFDAKAGRLLMTTDTSKAPNKSTQSSVTFDYAKSTAKYVNDNDTTKSSTLEMPAGEPMDLIMCLIQTRSWNMKPGEKKDALVIFEGEFYELTIYADRYEDVNTPMGKFKTLVLVPKMEKTPPKGMFKRGSTVSVWISQDERHLPVKFQVELKIGAATAVLTGHTPATSTPVAELK